MTAFVVVRYGNEAVTLDSVEPQRTTAHVAYRPGSRHPIDRGAPGLAILAGQAALPDERPEVTEARRRGWAYTTGEVVPGLASVATWVTDAHHGVASIACVFLAGVEVDLNATAAAPRRRRRLDQGAARIREWSRLDRRGRAARPHHLRLLYCSQHPRRGTT